MSACVAALNWNVVSQHLKYIVLQLAARGMFYSDAHDTCLILASAPYNIFYIPYVALALIYSRGGQAEIKMLYSRSFKRCVADIWIAELGSGQAAVFFFFWYYNKMLWMEKWCDDVPVADCGRSPEDGHLWAIQVEGVASLKSHL